MTFENYITIASTLRNSIQGYWKTRNTGTPAHNTWTRKQVCDAVQALRYVRKLSITY